MNIVRTLKKYNLDFIKQDSFYLGESLVMLNQVGSFGIPFKVGNIFFHLLPKEKNQDINSLISFYNKKDVSLKQVIDQVVNFSNPIIDLEFNYMYLYSIKDLEFKEYLHPIKQQKELMEELYKNINIVSKKIGTESLFSLVSSDKMKPLLSMYQDKYQILSEQEFSQLIIGKKFIVPSNKRDRDLKRIDLFNTIISGLSSTKRYKETEKIVGKNVLEERLNKEIDVIIQDKYIEYFLNYYIISQYLKQKKIIFFLKGSAVGSLLLYLLEIGNINPLVHNIPFERFLNKGKIADIDIDIPSIKRDEILIELNNYFNKQGYEVLLILNKSSNNFDKFTEHPSGILIEETNYINTSLPLQLSEREHLQLRTCQLYDSSTTPVLEEYGYLKYDLIRSQVLEELQESIRLKGHDIYNILDNWENLIWNPLYLGFILEGDFFQINSIFAKDLVKKTNPRSYFDLVKIIACNRPALMRLYDVDYLSLQLQNREPIKLIDSKLQSIIESSKSGKLILFQDQVIDLLLEVLPNVDYSSVIKLVKARGDVLGKYKQQFIIECTKRVNDKKYAEELWTMIENFDQYGLNKAHSSSYALITYLQLYNKSLEK